MHLKVLFSQGNLVRTESFHLAGLPSGRKKTRFGCTVRRKAASTSVARNRLKRWLREVFRRNQNRFPSGMDIGVAVVRPPLWTSYAQVEAALLRSAAQLRRSTPNDD